MKGWITRPGAAETEVTPTAFRREFTLSELPRRTVMSVTGFMQYAVRVNGRFASAGPARGMDLPYDTVDVTALLREGGNAVTAVVLPHHGQSNYGSPHIVGFCMELTADDGRTLLTTADGWTCAQADWFGCGKNRLSGPLPAEEHFDAEREPRGWMLGGFSGEGFIPCVTADDDFPDSEPRPTPRCEENETTGSLVWLGRDDEELWDTAENLTVRFNAEEMTGAFTEKFPYPTASPKREAPTADVLTERDGNLFVFDYGRTRMLRPVVELTDLDGEGRIELYYGIEMKERPVCRRGFGKPNEGFCDSFKPLSGASPHSGESLQTGALSHSGASPFPGVISYETLTGRGCRFVTVRAAGKCRFRLRMRTRTLDYPFGAEKTLDCTDPFLRRVFEMGVNSIRSSAGDVYVDTCERENALWTFDACVIGRAAFDVFGETALWRRSLAVLAQTTDPDGAVHSIGAARNVPHTLADQTCFYVINCLEYAKAAGDVSLLCETAPVLERFLLMLESGMTDDGLLLYPARSWHFVDWAGIDRRPYSLPFNCLALLAARAMTEIASLIGEPERGEVGKRLAARLERSLTRFYDPEAGCFLCHIEPTVPPPPYNTFGFKESDTEFPHGLHANIFALWAGIGDDAMRQSTVRFLKARFAEPFGAWHIFGPGWMNVVLTVLVENGLCAEARRVLHEKFAPLVSNGGVTVGESCGSSPYNTAHGWGAAVCTALLRLPHNSRLSP